MLGPAYDRRVRSPAQVDADSGSEGSIIDTVGPFLAGANARVRIDDIEAAARHRNTLGDCRLQLKAVAHVAAHVGSHRRAETQRIVPSCAAAPRLRGKVHNNDGSTALGCTQHDGTADATTSGPREGGGVLST